MTNTTATLLSPYACARVVNGWLEADGIDKKLPPQMMYTYVKKDYIKSVPAPEGAKVQRLVTEQALADWYALYTKKTVEVEEVQDLEVDGVAIDDEQTVLFEA